MRVGEMFLSWPKTFWLRFKWTLPTFSNKNKRREIIQYLEDNRGDNSELKNNLEKSKGAKGRKRSRRRNKGG